MTKELFINQIENLIATFLADHPEERMISEGCEIDIRGDLHYTYRIEVERL